MVSVPVSGAPHRAKSIGLGQRSFDLIFQFAIYNLKFAIRNSLPNFGDNIPSGGKNRDIRSGHLCGDFIHSLLEG
jgi:hypothetical protein